MRTLLLLFVSLSLACASTADRDLAREADRLARNGTFAGEVLLARNGRPLLHESYGTGRRTYNIASVGKMFTGVAIAQLAARGLVAYDAPVSRYLAELPYGAEVTIEQLLTHTAGIPDLPEDLFRTPPPTLAGYLPFLRAAKLEFAPGQKRAYSNSGYIVLGLVIEQVTGATYAHYLQQQVFRPARMHHTRAAGPHGGAQSTAADLLRFLERVRRGRLAMKRHHGFGELAFDTDRLVGHSGGDTGASADAYTYWNSGYTIVVLSHPDPPASHDLARAIRKLIEPRFTSAPGHL